MSKSRVGIKNAPAYVQDKEKCAQKLSKIIGMDKSKILKRLNTKGAYQVEFGTYGSNLSSTVKEKIDNLGIMIPHVAFVAFNFFAKFFNCISNSVCNSLLIVR